MPRNCFYTLLKPALNFRNGRVLQSPMFCQNYYSLKKKPAYIFFP